MTTDVTVDTGAAAGYRPQRTLSFAAEMRRQGGRRRTQVALALMVLLPLILIAAFAVGDSDGGSSREDETFSSLVDIATGGALNFAVFALFVTSLLSAIIVALFFGDTVASEASWGSLRYLLAIPVPRARLLAIKSVVSASYTVLAVTVLMGTSLIAGTLAYGWEPLALPTGGEISEGSGLVRLLVAAGYVIVAYATIAGMAFLLSTATDAPLGAVGGAVLLYIVSTILSNITALGDFRKLLPTWFHDSWIGLLATPADTDAMVTGVLSALLYATAFFGIAWWNFLRKDIVS